MTIHKERDNWKQEAQLQAKNAEFHRNKRERAEARIKELTSEPSAPPEAEPVPEAEPEPKTNLCIFLNSRHTFSLKDVEITLNNETTLAFSYLAMSDGVRKHAMFYKTRHCGFSIYSV